MKLWQRLSICALLGVLLSWTISCVTLPSNNSTGSNAGAGSQEVEFWTMQLKPQFEGYFNNLIAAFETENPGVKVRWVDVPWSAMESKILAAVSAKTAPDVVNLNPNFASLLAGRNAWLYLDSKIPEAIRQQYLPNIWQANTFKGQSFGVPWYLTTRITIYNTQLFEGAGINQPPKNYAELATIAAQIKEKTGKYAFFMTFVPEDSNEVMESFVQMGVKLVDDQGKAAFNTSEGKAAFQYWVNLYQQGLLPKEVLTQGHRRAIELYQAGEIALLASGPQFFKTITQNAPEIAKVSVAAPEIIGPNGKTNVAVMNLVVPQATDQPENAVKFALFVTNSQNQLAFAKDANVLPSTQESLTDSYFQTLPANPSQVDQARVMSAKQLKNAQVLVPAMPDVNQLKKILYDNLQAAMLKEKTVDQALADAEKAWNTNR